MCWDVECSTVLAARLTEQLHQAKLGPQTHGKMGPQTLPYPDGFSYTECKIGWMRKLDNIESSDRGHWPPSKIDKEENGMSPLEVIAVLGFLYCFFMVGMAKALRV